MNVSRCFIGCWNLLLSRYDEVSHFARSILFILMFNVVFCYQSRITRNDTRSKVYRNIGLSVEIRGRFTPETGIKIQCIDLLSLFSLNFKLGVFLTLRF